MFIVLAIDSEISPGERWRSGRIEKKGTFYFMEKVECPLFAMAVIS
jgi:hypothetical protein